MKYTALVFAMSSIALFVSGNKQSQIKSDSLQLLVKNLHAEDVGQNIHTKLASPPVPGVIKGRVFNDANFDGLLGKKEVGVAKLGVNVYDAKNTLVAKASTNEKGSWMAEGLNDALKYRVELVVPANLASRVKSTPRTIEAGAKIQFAQPNTTDVNFGVYDPSQFIETNPRLITPCYIGGNSSGAEDALVQWRYNDIGEGADNKLTSAEASQVGSLWGVAYNRQDGKVYTSAVLKRHVGLHESDAGGGLDAIYINDPYSSKPNSELWLELQDDLRIPVGSIPNNTERGLDVVPNYDVEAFAAAGKIGLGGIKISDDGSTLYAMNLNDKTVYAIDIESKSLVDSYAIPDPGCVDGTFRPWGLGIRDGVLYAGAVCDGSNLVGSPPDLFNITARQVLSAHVFKLEAGTFSSVLSFPLDYLKEPPFTYGGNCRSVTGWYGWIDEWPNPCEANNIGYPQPILSDIDWDDQGDMILGFMDRSGLQIGSSNYGLTGETIHSVYNGGDILHACNDGSDNWVIENPATCSNANGGAIGGTNNTYLDFILPSNPDYPNAGEFFVGDFFHDAGDLVSPGWLPGHAELSLGALAVLPGAGEVVVTAYDPLTAAGGLFNRGGVIKLSTTAGIRTAQGYQLYNSETDDNLTFGKGTGLGDLEIITGRPQSFVGTHIWNDADMDGIQDSDESALEGVTVSVYREDVLIATDVTDSKGFTDFASATATPEATWVGTGEDEALNSGVEYTFRIASDQSALANYGLTIQNAEDDNVDQLDSDAIEMDSELVIPFQIEEAGTVQYDFGIGLIDEVVDEEEDDSCVCREAIYLNEPAGNVHKYYINPDNTLTEVGSPWYGGNEMPSPHGLAIDINGNPIIGEDFRSSDLRKFKSNGEIFPESEFKISTTGQFNLASNGGSVFTNERTTASNINEYDLCTGELVGSVSFCEDINNGRDWGYYRDPRTGIHYATIGFDSGTTNYLWIFTDADFENDVCISAVNDSENGTLLPGDLRGVVTDIDGNIYLAYQDTPGSEGETSLLVKYDSAGTTELSRSLEDSVFDGTGHRKIIGLVYSEDNHMIYASTESANEPCITAFDPEDLTQGFDAVPPTPGGNNAKGIAILKECCPGRREQVIDTTLCVTSAGTKIFLQDVLSCEGTISEGEWEEAEDNSGMTFNPCDNSITIDVLDGCGSFTFESDGIGSNLECGAFVITTNVCVIPGHDVQAETTAADCYDPNNLGSITLTVSGGTAPFTYDWADDQYDGLSSITGLQGGTYPVTVSSSTGCTKELAPTVESDCGPDPCTEGLGGRVFGDVDADGRNEEGETGPGGVKVQVFGCNDLEESYLIETTFTDLNGDYYFSDPTIVSGNPYRIEFTELPEGYVSSLAGADNLTNTRFVDEISCNIHFGVINEAAFCGGNPMMVTPCYVSSPSANEDVLIRFSYNNEGTADLDKTTIAESQMTGSLWGVAYAKKTKSIYTSAVLKGHIPLGPSGLDAIYLVDPFADAANATPWLELTDDMNIAVSSVTADPQYLDNTARSLNELVQNDAVAFQDVGKVGIGDIELSEDEETLYVVNLYDKTIYAISTMTKELLGTYPIPDPGCVQGEARPWALAERNGIIYVGVTCDGAASGNPSDFTDNSGVENLRATVYQLEAESFVEVLNFPLDYPREEPFTYSDGCNQIDRWKPWLSVMPATCADGNIGYPTPLLTDIEFAANGDMILGFTDRTGFQFGYANYGPAGTEIRSGYSGGDILKACYTGTSWQIENVASGCASEGLAIHAYDEEGYVPSFGGFLPKEGEFFYGDYFHGDGEIDGTGLSFFPGHAEITIGGLAIVPGSGEVISTSFDPVTGAPNFNTGGVIYLDLATGKRSRNGFQLYATNDPNTTLGKGIGLGDIEALCGEVPIQIGNYVWADVNGDGIQDPCEPPVADLTVKLYTKMVSEAYELIATTKTNELGNYYFTNDETEGETWEDGFENIEKDSSYVVVFCGDRYNEATGLLTVDKTLYELTVADTGRGDSPDLNDSDAQPVEVTDIGVFPAIAVTASETEHSLDLGLLPKPDLALTNKIDQDLFGLKYGDTVKFEMTVFNQSLVKVDSLEITNYLPEGYTFDETITGNEAWTVNEDGYLVTILDEEILSAASDSACLYLTLEKVDDFLEYVDVAEISAAWIDGELVEDCDSPLNGDPEDNVGSVVDTQADDFIDGDGTASEPDGVADTDQDNVDPAKVPICDLALVNVVEERPATLQLGDTIKYKVVLENQGTEAATNIEVFYSIPDGLAYLDANDAADLAWTVNGNQATTTVMEVLNPGEKDSICIFLAVDNVSIEEVEVDSWTTFAEIGSYEDPASPGVEKSDIDSSPDDDPANDSGGNPDDETDDVTYGNGEGNPDDPAEDSDPSLDEDDHDPAKIEVCDAAVKIYTEETGPFLYQDTVKFNVVVYNQGNSDLTNITINDFYGSGMSNVSTFTNTTENWLENNGHLTTTYSEVLKSGESDTICLDMQIVSSLLFDVDSYLQVVEIASFEDPDNPDVPKMDIDSTPDADPDNDSGGNPDDMTDDVVNGDGTGDPLDPIDNRNPAFDEDDNDPVLVDVFDLALKKITVDDRSYAPGEKVDFLITVYNQGNVIADNFVVTDYLRDGFTFSETDNSGWFRAGDNIEYLSSRSLAAGASVDIPLRLMVTVPPSPVSVEDWWNYAEISSADDDDDTSTLTLDADSHPDNMNDESDDLSPDDLADNAITENGLLGGDEDDHDVSAVIVGFDLALTKEILNEGPYRYGDTLTYRIAVSNEGGMAVTQVQLYDAIPCGLDFLQELNPAWTFSNNVARTTLENLLSPGSTSFVDIQLVVQRCDQPGFDNYHNVAEISEFKDEEENEPATSDIDSTPNENPADDPESEDDHDSVDVEVCDLALTNKVVELPSKIEVGDTVKFEVVIHNQGNNIVNGVEVAYLIPNGFEYLAINETTLPNWTLEGDAMASVETTEVIQPGDTDSICIFLAVINVPTGEVIEENWTTVAEITSYLDESSEVKITDADSTPDDNFDNDPGGNPDDETDDVVDGDGSGDLEDPVEDGNPELDEDDHDPAKVDICDVATIIYTEDEGPHAYGDEVKYVVEIHNQGNGLITNIELQNLFGEGLDFIECTENLAAGWSENSDGDLAITVSETIKSGDTLELCLFMEVQPTVEPAYDNYLQTIEVVRFENPEYPGKAKVDIDSTADDDPTNDTGGNPDDETDNTLDGDGSGDVDDPVEDTDPNLDEDDHDAVDIEICDVALINKLEERPETIKVSDTIKYEVVLQNQGNNDVAQIDVNYLMPNGFSFVDENENLSPAWSMVNDSLLQVTTQKLLLPGEFDTLCLYLQVNNLETDEVTPDSWTTLAEIAAYDNGEGESKITDADSVPDDDPANDPGGNPDDDTDNELDGDGTGDPSDPDEDTDPELDEDDHDTEILYVCDLATNYIADIDPESYLDMVQFKLELHNQGNRPITNIRLENLFAEGWEYVPTVSNVETGWVLDTFGVLKLFSEEVIDVGEMDTLCLELKVIPDNNGGLFSWQQVGKITSFDDPEALTLAKDDVDSDPEIQILLGITQPENDLVFIEDVKVFDLATIIEIDSMPPVLPVVPGDVLKFIVVTTNQGNTEANNILLSNYVMPENLKLADISEGVGWAAINDSLSQLTLTETLAPGAMDTTCIYLEVVNGGMADIITWVEISGSDETDADCFDMDSTPDEINGNDVGGVSQTSSDDHIEDDGADGNDDGITDEDDHDPAQLFAQDLALIVWTDHKDPVKVGQDINFIVKVVNQGNIENDKVKVVTYLPEGLSLSSNDGNGWVVESEDLISLSLPESLPMGAEQEVNMLLQVKPGAVSETLIIYSEIASSIDTQGNPLDDRDVDSTPDEILGNDNGGEPQDPIDCNTEPTIIVNDNRLDGAGRNGEDEDDQDPAWVHVFDLATIIYTNQTLPIIPGDDIKFEIEIHNQGNMAAENVELSLYVPDGFALSENDAFGWSTSGDNSLSMTHSERLEPLTADSICLVLTVLPDHVLESLIPFVEISMAMDTLGHELAESDLDSNSDADPTNDIGGFPDTDDDDRLDGLSTMGEDEDDHDPVVPPVLDLAIRIVNVDEGPKVPGDLVKFDVTVFNQGSVVPGSFVIENYVPEGLRFRDMPENDGWSIQGSNAVYTYDNNLLPTESDSLCIFLEVTDKAHPANVVDMIEIVSITDDQGENISDRDIDSVSESNNENDKGNDLYSAEDNKILENGRSGGDEDDHDQAFVLLCQDMLCLSQVNVSLNENCEAQLTAEMLMTGDLFPNEFYEISISDGHGSFVGSPLVNSDDLGLHEFQVFNPICDNYCWGQILIEFKQLPQIVCPANLTLSCAALDALPLPEVATSVCAGTAEVVLANEVRERLDCDEEFTHRVSRVYMATDGLGNTASCEQEILLERVDLSGLQFPFSTTIMCSQLDSFVLLSSGVPMPFVQSPNGDIGVPTLCTDQDLGIGVDIGMLIDCPFDPSVSAVPLIPNEGISVLTPDGPVLLEGNMATNCSALLIFNDVEIPTPGCDRRIIRTFEVFEWFCGTEIPASGSMTINIIDDKAPVFECPDDFTVTTDDNCGGQVSVPSVSPIDGCSNGYQIGIFHSLGSISTNGGEVNLEVGENEVTYVVSDNCNNSSSCQVIVTVRDLTEPVAICEGATTVSLNDAGTARVPAAVFDDGSWDECGIGRMQVSLMPVPGDFSNLNFGPYVDFDCANEGLEIMVVYRVFDLGGNFSDCMVMVEVQDKTAPQITCPKDFTVDCRETIVLDNLTLAFGEPAITDNCAQMYVAQETVSSDLDQCGNGEVVRSFDIIRNGVTLGITCQQNITVTDLDPFQASDIVWPVDLGLVDSGRCSVVDLAPSNLDPPFGVPTFPTVDDHCALLGVDFSDVVSGQGGCMTITRHWAVIDWCNQTNGTFAIFEIPQDQVITISSTTTPDIVLSADPIIFSSNTGDCVNSDVSVSVTAPNVCQEGLVWTYTVRDLGGAVFASGNDNVLANEFAAGTYNIEWTATTACGITTSETQGLLVQNTKAPIPVCMNGMPLPLVDGTATLEPSMIDVGSYSSCNNPIQVSFSSDVTDVIRTFTCVQQGDMSIELWVTDAVTGVSDFCIAQITVVPDMTCTPNTNMFSVSGEIFTEYYESIENVEVTIANDVPSTHTDAEGNYAFQQMPTSEIYEVLPSKNVGHGNGINTLDLIHLQRHILGLQRIESPYQLIAADINNSQNVDATDLVELRKLILGIYQEFPDNESWRFIDSSHEFLDISYPWNDEGMESKQIHNMRGDVTADFIGVKIGDVDGTAVSSLNGSVADLKSQRWPLILEMPALTLESDQSVKVPVYANNYENISGWQGTLEFDPKLIEIISVQPMTSGMNELEFNMDQVEKGTFTFLFADLETNDYDNNEPLFIIEMKSNREIEISDYLRLGSSLTSKEAYRGYRDVVPLELQFRQDNFENKILAVFPNPWIETTKISVEIGKPGDVKWEFYDNSGSLIHSYNQNYTKGTHYLTLNNSDIPVEGVIFVKLITKDEVFDYKMVKY